MITLFGHLRPRTSAVTPMLAVVLSAALLGACGRPAGLPESSDGPMPRAEPGAVALADALTQLETLAAPDGVGRDAFAELKAALAAALEQSGQTRFASRAPGDHGAVDDLALALVNGQPGVQWTYRNPGDYNSDGEVNGTDVVQVALYLLRNTLSPDWDRASRADGDRNGEVNAADIVPIAANFLTNVITWRVEAAHSEAGPWVQIAHVPIESGLRFDSSAPPRYSIAVDPGFSKYRVVPLSIEGESGAPSNIATETQLSKKTRMVGGDSELQFVNLEGNALTLLVQPDHGLVGGEVLIGEDAGGFVLHAKELVAAGEYLMVFGEHGTLSDALSAGLLQRRFGLQPADIELEDVTLAVGKHLLHLHSGILDLATWIDVTASFDAAGWSRVELDLVDATSMQLDFSFSRLGEGGNETQAERLVAAKDLYFIPAGNGLLPLPLDGEVRVYLGARVDSLPGSFHAHSGHQQNIAGHSTSLSLERGGTLQGSVGIETELDLQVEDWNLDGAASVEVYLRAEYHITAFGASRQPGGSDFVVTIEPTDRLEIEPAMGPLSVGSSSGIQAGLQRTIGCTAELGRSLLGDWDPQGVSFELQPPLSYGPAYFSPPEIPLHRIGGRLISSEGSVIGATVTAGSDGFVIAQTTSVAQGRYQFDLPEGLTVTITPTMPGHIFTPPSKTLTVTAPNNNVDFSAIVQQALVRGTVREDGEPLVGTTVLLARDGAPTQSTVTDFEGRYSFSVPLGATVTVHAERDEYIFTPSQATFTVYGEVVQDFVAWAVPAFYTLSGLVHDEVHEFGLSGVYIYLYDEESEEFSDFTTTGITGYYEFTGLASGRTFHVYPDLEGAIFDPPWAEVTMNGNQTQNFVYMGFEYWDE